MPGRIEAQKRNKVQFQKNKGSWIALAPEFMKHHFYLPNSKNNISMYTPIRHISFTSLIKFKE